MKQDEMDVITKAEPRKEDYTPNSKHFNQIKDNEKPYKPGNESRQMKSKSGKTKARADRRL